MNRDDIIRMAREAGFKLTMWQLSFGYEACGTHETFERFAALVAAAEREACAKICDEKSEEWREMRGWLDDFSNEIAAAIRARGQS